uniref:OTU deubiquitinase with linear linkage specificity a n=1 Tax=Amphilophus citrinellus TaxID=61819 RepID=A0A3Q0SCF7_AMPCI
MSWVKAVSLSGEDVFDESADDLSLQNKEWTSNMKKRLKSLCLTVLYGAGARSGIRKTPSLPQL